MNLISEYKVKIIDFFSDKTYFYLNENKNVEKRDLNFLQICLRNGFGFFSETHSRNFLNACYAFTLLEDGGEKREEILKAVRTVSSKIFYTSDELSRKGRYYDFTLYEAPVEIENADISIYDRVIAFFTIPFFKKGFTIFTKGFKSRLDIGYQAVAYHIPEGEWRYQNYDFGSNYFRLHCRLERKLNLLGSVIEKIDNLFRKITFYEDSDYTFEIASGFIVNRIDEDNIEIQTYPLDKGFTKPFLNAQPLDAQVSSLKFEDYTSWTLAHLNAIEQGLKSRLKDNVNIWLKVPQLGYENPQAETLQAIGWNQDHSKAERKEGKDYIYYQHKGDFDRSSPIANAISKYQVEFALGLDLKADRPSVVKKAV